MKTYIHTDIEGVAGWVFYAHDSDSRRNQNHIRRMNQLLTNEVSAAAQAAALAGYHGVPCVCVSGDDKICVEVGEKVPTCERVVVKWGIAAQNARCLSPTYACEKIFQGVQKGLARRDDVKPYRIEGPYRINISDRDPAKMILAQDVQGDDFWETVHRAANTTDYCSFGEDMIDDRRFRWPG